MKVIVTAGPTQESVDPVRYITNHSTGKMGYELAKAAMLRGAEVTLVSGVTNLEPPMFVDYVQVKSAGDMFEAMKSRFLDNDIIIKGNWRTILGILKKQRKRTAKCLSNWTEHRIF